MEIQSSLERIVGQRANSPALLAATVVTLYVIMMGTVFVSFSGRFHGPARLEDDSAATKSILLCKNDSPSANALCRKQFEQRIR